MGLRSTFNVFSLFLAALGLGLHAGPTMAQSSSTRLLHAVPAAVASYQGDDYGDEYGHDHDDWRQQIRVASPSRHARWNSAPLGAVRVYDRRFDPRWNWRSAPRYRVVYTYYRGDLWFLDPTTGWAYSIDRYGIVYTADPARGWVYSLGPLTRWTADLLYFFDLYRFDRGYWYCRDYDYLVDLWEDHPRYGYYTYDTAYSTLWDWEPYFNSPSFISYVNQFTVIWVGQVRSHYDYIEHNPRYRRELIDSIGLPAVQAAPPRTVSPRAVTTTAYWEARDLAAAGMAPPARGRDTGPVNPGLAAGTVVDARQRPSRVVEPGSPAPGFNAPFPDGSYGFGVRPGANSREPDNRTQVPSGRGRDTGSAAAAGRDWSRNNERVDQQREPAVPAYQSDSGRNGGSTQRGESGYRGETPQPRNRVPENVPPQFDEPTYTPAPATPREDQRSQQPASGGYSSGGRNRDTGRTDPVREQPRYEAPRQQSRPEPPREEPRPQTYREPVRESRQQDRPEQRQEKPSEQRQEKQPEQRQDKEEQRSASRAALGDLGVKENQR
jgi:hypothetical protein